ncbi:hypothetical protein [Nocardia abscessus]|uniref:hypothetical protein n=1 Tax=Nocardia abscessus TaxID=120957 RepID=UPI002455BC62|nr:hypothetical protein [Nocardia abscessus]
MGALWSELGKKLADRWLTLLVLPGVLYLAFAATAATLGHTHGLDIGLLTCQITGHANSPTVTSTGGQVVLLAATLAGAAAVGLAAQALGTLVEQAALAANWRTWPPPLQKLAGRWTTHRQHRWDTAHTLYHDEHRNALAPDPAHRPDPAARHRAARTRRRIAVERPERPTWSGDRIQAAAVRVDRDHHLDLSTVWPYLWLILPANVRDQLTQARTDLTRATTLAAWSLIYLPLALRWWPAALLAAVLAAIARHRIRAATDTYATLLEATARLYATTLAIQLGIDHSGPLTAELGHTLTRHLHTQPPPPFTI